MRCIITLFFCILATNAYAKKLKIIDTTRILCSYEYIEVCDTLKGETRNDILYLEIGSNYSKCYSYYTFRYDSLQSTPKGRTELMRRFALFSKNVHSREGEDMISYWQNSHPYYRLSTCVYKNYREEKMTVTDFILADDYLYEDSFEQEWKMSEDSTKTILGYECQQATCKFRGREWTAWFALGIPISDGPWKLCNLPGLIMEAYDRRRQKYFCINGIEQTVSNPIYYGTIGKEIDRFEKTTYTEFIKARYEEFRGNSSSNILMEQLGIPTSGSKHIPRFDWLERQQAE